MVLCFPPSTAQNRNLLLVGCTLNVTLFYVCFNMRKLRHREAMVPGRPQCSPQRFAPLSTAANNFFKGPAAHTPIILTFGRW